MGLTHATWRLKKIIKDNIMFIYKKENQLPIKSWIPEEQYYADEKIS